MKVKPNLWRLYNAATAYGGRPSDYFELETELAAWQLDEACLIVGRRIENNLNQGKDMWDGFSAAEIGTTVGKKKYSSVKGLRPLKKVKIKPNGTW